LPDTAPHDVEYAASDESEGFVNPSSLSAEEIRAFIQKSIEGKGDRLYKINPPPVGRPVRIYADGR
jgi:choline-phosphate cytidylyltransferase